MRGRLALAAVLAPVALLPAPAQAAPVALVIDGYGTYFPGYTVFPTVQTMTLTGTATEVGTGTVHACHWSMLGLAETLANGAGTWDGSCGPHTFTGCVFTRAGTHATVGCPSGWAGELVWVVDVTSAYEFTADGVVATP